MIDPIHEPEREVGTDQHSRQAPPPGDRRGERPANRVRRRVTPLLWALLATVTLAAVAHWLVSGPVRLTAAWRRPLYAAALLPTFFGLWRWSRTRAGADRRTAPRNGSSAEPPGRASPT
jgi:hypothetical protein